MAIGAISRVGIPETLGQTTLKFFKVTLPTSYTTGGDIITAASLGFRDVIAVNVMGVANAAGGATGVMCGWRYSTDPAAGKLQAFWTGAVVSTALAEVTSTTNLSTMFVYLAVYGHGL